MICNLQCLSCEHPTCIRDEREKEVYRRYYQKNREKRTAYQRSYYAAHKDKEKQRAKARWANMTEEQKEIKRARQREAYKRKKCNAK